MARVPQLVLVALAWCAVRADEYGGASMPQYSDSAEYAAAPMASLPGSALDYRGHSPDAPAPLDYKYEEEPQGNTEKSTKHTIELPDSWKRPARKQRGLKRDRDEPSDGGGGADLESLPKLKPSRRRHLHHRSRLAGDKSYAEDDPELPRRRRRGRHGRIRDDYSQPMDYKGDYRVDNKVLDEDVDTYTLRETTEIIMQRKPRNELLSKFVKPLKSDLDSDEDLLSDRNVKRERAGEGQGGGGEVRFSDREENWPVLRQPPPLLPEDEDEEAAERPRPRGRHKPKDYDYNENYEIRRLPKLVRRTTTWSPLAGKLSATTGNLLSQLWTAAAARRARPIVVAATVAPEPAPAPSDTLAQRGPDPDLDPELNPELAHSGRPDPPERTTIGNAAGTPPNNTKTTPIPVRTSTVSKTILSFAEKSRLSILKKSQKKENEKGDPSKKPLVLLQVTRKVPTIVMVEPPTSANPWMRARYIANESPKKLEKVKRLMRRKLVASARSIQDLTNNWDDMVCDYIDMSLLDVAIVHQMSLSLLCVTLALVLVIR